MRSARTLSYALLSFAATATIVACAGRSSGPLPAAPQGAPQAGERADAAIPARDLGRRASRSPVGVVIALRFNNPAELNRLADEVSNPNSGRFRHFLKPSEFESRFAPTVAQHARVIAALRAAGFTIVHTFANRVLIDASAPSGTAERFFQTRIHDFEQGKQGRRFSNVTPPKIPASIASLVASVELNDIVYARAAGEPQEEDAAPDTATKNLIVNGGFEKRMKGWQSCGKVAPAITNQHPQAGRFDALTGSLTATSGDVKGWSSICQQVTIPQNATLVAYLYGSTNAKSTADSFQAVGLMNKPNGKPTILIKRLNDKKKWIRASFDLSKYAGRTVYIFFGVHGTGQKKLYDTQFVDTVSLIGTVASPSPSPSPTSSASSSPSASPSPSPHPTGPVTAGPDTPLTGPTFGPSNGWAPRGVADGFDFPVQHGYAGDGVNVGIVADQKAAPDDLTAFYSYNGIAPRPSVAYRPIGDPTTSPNDSTEATLDIEAVTGLAPGARVIVYQTIDLSNESVLNAYNAALSDAKVQILESSFGECEAEDANFVATTDQLATAGAALGMTFVAAAGDEGSACYNGTTNVIGVNAPASGPHFLGVGGTQSLVNGSVANKAVWNDRTSGTGVGIGGGGISTSWPIPTYQQGISGSPSSASQRNVPDMALPAVNDDLFIKGTNEQVEGTSWSSSIATALIASSIQFCGDLGWVNPAFYAVYAAHPKTPAFIDVINGFNGGFAGGLPHGYSAATGYDNASGIGMPNGITFGVALCGRTTTLLRHH
jgi:Pro-kumamolisin, activation domain